MRLVGVDATGTEDACVLDKGFALGPSNATEAAAIASWNINSVRVPLNEDCWLGINGVPPKYSGVRYQTKIEMWVSALNQAGIVAILDLQWAAPGTDEAIRLWPMADADHSITFWSQVASAFSSSPSVMFDLFNEPSMGKQHPTAANWACWLNGCQFSFVPSGSTSVVTYQTAGMQQLLDAVRATGAAQPVMVGGLDWAGDPCGVGDAGGNGGTCMWLDQEPNDPLHQLILSFHSYAGKYCSTVSCWTDSVLPVAANVPVVTGELGEKDCATTYISAYMQWADQHDISYLLWAWEPGHQDDTTSTNCSNQNLRLISNWNGATNTLAPAGAVFKAHLNSLAESGALSK